MIIDEHIPRWSDPGSYAGHNPEGSYIVAQQHRDSNTIVRSNYERIFADVLAKARELGQAEGAEQSPPDPKDGKAWRLYAFRASHWAVGWIDYIILTQNAPDALVIQVAEIYERLNDYPVYDEDHLSTLEYNEAAEYWAGLDVKERLAVIADSHAQISRFAARRSELPDNDRVFDWVRSI